MARIIGGSVIGELSGKMGGAVFARNRGGAYVRQYVVPVDPRTSAQISARSNFGIAASNYHGLNEDQKSLWRNFASNVFNPKTGRAGVPSGFNAYVSLQNVINNFRNLAASFKFDGIAAPTTAMNFKNSNVPPSFALEANFLLNTPGTVVPYTLTSLFSTNWTYGISEVEIPISFDLRLNGGVGPSSELTSTVDAKGNIFGFKLFMSNALPQASSFVENPYLIDLGTIKPVAFTTPGTSVDVITVTATALLQNQNYNSIPEVGQWVEISLFAVSQTGMLLKIGSKRILSPIP